ncbi:lytic transglycosylase domain-containing protein [Sphingomonas sp. UV9]|uniref:lytic transglycosylase domain-containing protein n=1 Tax=Sphingomonas sp. UV9 TaxID=1851410 RepID=UPI000FFBF36F|nr:lytic transglycosylase domain-containing protein [Sphingomonas sp. UV9]RXD05632.1 lytic transglycosylase domain-containing protein [Sphingomonas sp. UV9]
MVASMIKTSLLLAVVAGTVAASEPGQQTLDRYSTQLANMGPNAQPMAPPMSSDGAIASTIATWRALQQTDALPFDSYAGFLMAHPGWPNETANRRAAERKASTGSPMNVAAFFRRYPPQSASGGVAYARALMATGQRDQAYAAVRTAWRSSGLTPTDEAMVTSAFPGALTPDDQDARMDALLWAGQTSAAQRQLVWTSAARRPIFAARLAFRTNAPTASDISASTQTLYANDAGYVADRAQWLRNSGASPSARAWLARPRSLTTRPGNPAEWYEVLVTNAQAAANDGQYQVAYDIARQIDDAYPYGTDVSTKSYAERDEYTNLAWLGGRAAMKQLGRPADAMTLFDRYARGSRSPQVRSKGYYWAGRAAEAAGLAPQAAAFYGQAAGYRDQYYGQLANERTGRALVAPPSVASVAVDPAARAAFDRRETVRAVKFLGQINDWQDQTAFVRQIAADATTDTDHLLAAELSTSINRPDLGVMVGRSALANGLSDYSAVGFPMVAVPAGYESNWTMIHAISRQESQFDRAAISHAGARGLMQLMPATAREQSGKIGLAYNQAALTTDPNMSIMLGSSYFQRVYANYGSYPLAVAAYNAGGGNVNKWLRANGDPRTGSIDIIDWVEAIPYQETRNYVQRVLENAVVYDLMNPARAKSRGAARLSWYLGKNRPG